MQKVWNKFFISHSQISEYFFTLLTGCDVLCICVIFSNCASCRRHKNKVFIWGPSLRLLDDRLCSFSTSCSYVVEYVSIHCRSPFWQYLPKRNFKAQNYEIITIIIIVTSIIVIILVITFMQGIYNYIPVTNHVWRVYSVAAVLYLQFVIHVMLFHLWNIFCTFTLALSIVCVQRPIWLCFVVP